MPYNEITDRIARQNLQKYLRQLAYFEPEIPLLPIDGNKGEDTSAAIREFQRSRSLPVTGIANRETFDRIYAEYLLSLSKNLPPIPFSPFPKNPVDYEVQPGDDGFLTSVIQHLLGEISVIYEFLPQLEMTGVYDDATENAVKTIQRASDLEETGRVDRRTWNAIVRHYNIHPLYSLE